ncbi:MFS transporter [Photobacterium sp. WH77]|uniref:MFS transporter n=1 Tax=Photobacterium arenosum TaxID=2774143 RepID=A0ABR9BM54_9GAMM|nr:MULTISPECIES: MFS transporter [Photobacterium]MBD8513644.1 MFS transporter [Photobacterium arenosum]MCG2838010.1 MFS transporter [Photobacterium sp. WH77]MCG2845628.1 MFS transporter [Photobacterium sp. WH80]
MEKVSVNKVKPSHRWKVLLVGIAANISFSMVVGGIPASAIFMRASYELSTIHLGWVMAMIGLGAALSELPWGVLTDRLGDRAVLVSGLLSTSVILLLMTLFVVPDGDFIPSLPLLATSIFFIGLLGSCVNGASGRAIMSWFQEGERGLAMSMRQSAVPAGYGIGALLFPFLALNYGFDVIYSVSAILCILCAVYSWLWLYEPQSEKTDTQQTKIESPAQQVKSPLKRADVWRVVLAIGILCTPQFAILTFATVFLHDYGKVGVTIISASLALIQVGAIVSRIWAGRWTDKRKNRKEFLRTCCLLSLATFLLLALEVSVLPQDALSQPLVMMSLVALITVSGIFVSAWHGVAYTELAVIAGVERTGTALAMGNTVVYGIFCITPVLIPVLVTFHGWDIVWLISGLSTLLALYLFPKPEKQVLVMNENRNN